MAVDDARLFKQRFNVSRETIERLTHYEALIKKWNPAINLVASSTLGQLWSRHFRDSAETHAIASPHTGTWADLGSGGGFPGLVVGILADELSPDLSVVCIESDGRKCEFMRTVARTVGISVDIISKRIEEAPPQNANYVSARALAPLPKLFGYINRHLAPDGTAILHKGEHWQQEVNSALESWQFSVEKHDNPSHSNSVILKIGDLHHG